MPKNLKSKAKPDQHKNCVPQLHIGEVTEIERGITFPAAVKHRSPSKGLVACLRTASVQEEVDWDDMIYVPETYVKHDSKYVRDGDTLISMANSLELVGKVAFIQSPMMKSTFGGFISVMRAVPDKVLPKYLFYVLGSPSFQQSMRNTARRSVNIANLSVSTISDLSIPVPSLKEQGKIVELMDNVLPRVRGARERIEKAKLLLRRFRQSILQSAYNGSLTADWRDSNEMQSGESLMQKIKEARLRNAGTRDRKHIERAFLKPCEADDVLPENWLRCDIGHVGSVSNGSTPSRKVERYWKGDILWVSSGEVKNGIITDTKEKITREGFENSSVNLLPVGTVLLAMIGEGKTRGQTAILDIEATTNQNVAAIQLPKDLVEPEFLFYWLRYQYALNRESGSGSGQQALNCQRVRELPFVLAPTEEQKEIVSRIKSYFGIADRVERRLEEVDLKTEQTSSSVLRTIFTKPV